MMDSLLIEKVNAQNQTQTCFIVNLNRITSFKRKTCLSDQFSIFHDVLSEKQRKNKLKTLLQDIYLIEKTKFVRSREIIKVEKCEQTKSTVKKLEELQCRLKDL